MRIEFSFRFYKLAKNVLQFLKIRNLWQVLRKGVKKVFSPFLLVELRDFFKNF